MIEHTRRHILIDRCKSILDNLKNCNSGAEIHKVANMRNIANLTIELLETCDSIEDSDISPIIKRLEEECVQHFKNKFSYLTRK